MKPATRRRWHRGRLRGTTGAARHRPTARDAGRARQPQALGQPHRQSAAHGQLTSPEPRSTPWVGTPSCAQRMGRYTASALRNGETWTLRKKEGEPVRRQLGRSLSSCLVQRLPAGRIGRATRECFLSSESVIAGLLISLCARSGRGHVGNRWNTLRDYRRHCLHVSWRLGRGDE